MSAPLMTVLMPVYNAERFLREAIDSILNQTFSQFEFLIIDDASTDNSIKIIESYNDPRIRLIRNERNMGISATLNKGIDLATTEWIARMDADDISYPHRLQKQYMYCKEHPECALLSAWAKIVNEDREFIRLEQYKTRYYYYNLTFECWIYHPTIVFRKDAVTGVGKYTVPYSEDFELFWEMTRKYKIGNIAEPLLEYRVTTSSLHQVMKKSEYDEAQEKQVRRNIAYYTDAVNLSYEELECLRHNFPPIVQKRSLRAILKCLKKLHIISEAILAKENVNNDPVAIKEAAFHKKEFTIFSLARALPKHKAIVLLLLTGKWKKIARAVKRRVKR